MAPSSERRHSTRNVPDEPLLSILQVKGLACNIESCAPDILYMFVDVHNCSNGGSMIRLPFQLAAGTVFNLSIAEKASGTWTTRLARIVWNKRHDDGHFDSGVEFLDNDCPAAVLLETDPMRPSPADLSFLLGASFFQTISDQGLCLLLNALRKTNIAASERIIIQGEPGECLYLIQEGICIVFVEKGGYANPIVRLGAGDVLGEMAVLTGEPRTASVNAETDMVLWKLDRRDFEPLADSHPELRLFLTEIMSNRFDSSLFVGDRTIGKYVLGSKIGKGGWGIVYRGVHKILKMPVAIKMMKHDMAMEKTFLDTFRQEAEIIARMSHPNIVSVYDIEEIYRTIFIIMEYLEGNSLKEHMKKIGAMPSERCTDILMQVCDGLACAHGLDIVHRDIKPANIFLLDGDRVKLLDFGLACASGTEDFNIAGTVHYASPEQIDGWPVDVRSDIYSMGVMAYEMVTGSKPYPGRNLADIMELHCSQDLPDPGILVPAIPSNLREFIVTCGRIKPEDRFQSAQAAREVLAVQGSVRRRTSRPLRRKVSRTVTSLVLLHSPRQQPALKALLEDFGVKAAELGVNLLMSEFKDV